MKKELFLMAVLISASVAFALSYQYGDSISCTNSVCEAISFELSTGESKTINLEDKSYTFKFVSSEKLPRDYEYYKAVIEVNGKTYDTESSLGELQQLFGLSYLSFYVHPTTKKLSITIVEDGLCKGELKYIACYNKYEVSVVKGWNLIATVALNADKEISTCDIDPLQRYIWLYNTDTKQYLNFKQAQTQSIQLSERAQTIMAAGSIWLYSSSNCKLVLKSEKATSSTSYEKFFTYVTLTMEQKNINYPAGWNFFQFTPDMIGKKLNDIKGTCQITKAFGWNSNAQKWENIIDVTFSSSGIGYGFVFKTDNECRLGEVIAPPPTLPS